MELSSNDKYGPSPGRVLRSHTKKMLKEEIILSTSNSRSKIKSHLKDQQQSNEKKIKSILKVDVSDKMNKKLKINTQSSLSQQRTPLKVQQFKNNTRKCTTEKKKQQHKTKLLRKSDSYDKYGLLLPSYETILSNINRLKNEAKILDNYEELYERQDVPFPALDFDVSIQNDDILLDCKHLTQAEINEYFHDNLDYMKCILNGETFSERHQRFEHYNPKYNLTVNDLTYSPSIVVFTDEQKDYLFTLLEENLDPEDKHTQYFFKVLLPELCFKIFKDVHNMTDEAAKIYLDWRPVD